MGKPIYRWIDNIKRNSMNLELDEKWPERATDRVGGRCMVVAAHEPVVANELVM